MTASCAPLIEEINVPRGGRLSVVGGKPGASHPGAESALLGGPARKADIAGDDAREPPKGPAASETLA
jgi:hypothetical protein